MMLQLLKDDISQPLKTAFRYFFVVVEGNLIGSCSGMFLFCFLISLAAVCTSIWFLSFFLPKCA